MTATLARFPRTALLVAGTCLIAVLFLAMPHGRIVTVASGPGHDETTGVWKNRTVGQTFAPLRNGLTAVRLETVLVPSPETLVEFRIRRVSTPQDLRVLRGPVRQFQTPDGGGLLFSFPPLTDIRNETLLLTIAAPSAAENQAIPVRFEIASDHYPSGERFENGRARPGDLGLTFWVRGGLFESWAHRFLNGTAGQWMAGILLAVLSGLILLDAVPFWKGTSISPGARFRIALLSSIVVALLYTFPVYARLGFWAADESDWPELVSHLSAARQTLAAGEFPGWNPYMCGGTPHLANPQTYFLSPTFLASLIFGEVIGPKLAFTFAIAIGLFGAFLLTETVQIRGLSVFLPGMVFLLSGFTTTHLANGQFLWLTLAWVPWIVTGFLRSLTRSRWWALLSAVFLTLTFIEGRVYLVAYVALYLGVLALALSVQRRSGRPLLALLLVGILTVLGSAWKLFPTLAFLADQEISLPNTDGIPWRGLDEAFLRRDVTPGGTDTFGTVSIPRHEYAAYVGIIPVLLAGLSLHRATRARAVPFLVAGGIFIFLATQSATASFFEYVPVLRELRNPSRTLSMVTLSIAVLSGLGLTVVSTFLRRIRFPQGFRFIVPAALTGLVLVNFLSVGWPQFMKLFRFPPQPQAFDSAAFFQTNVPERQVANGYPAVAAGKGAKDFCPAVLRAYRPAHHVRAREDRDYRGEAYAEGNATVRLLRLTPNTVRLLVDAKTGDTVVVNQQFDRGWSATPFAVKSHETLLAIDVPPGSHVVSLHYRPPWILSGTLITLVTLLGLGVLWRYRSRKQ